jgi:hypothetical protein
MTHLHPDLDAMTAHLMHLHGDQLVGLVEIAWTDREGALSLARLFDLGELDEAAEFAAERNAEGANVYCGAALRRETTRRDKRAGDADFLAASAYWVDLDDGAAVRAMRERCGEVPATFGVITGRHPEPRCQAYWKAEEAISDAAHVRKVNAGLAYALDGDPSTVNPGRVLRIGGSVAWPAKPGRVAELTRFYAPKDRPTAYVEGEVEHAFPPPPKGATAASQRPLHASGPSAPERWVTMLADGIPEGSRDHSLAALCGHLLAKRVDPEVTWHLLEAVNATRVYPPVSDSQLRKIFDSICKRELAKEAA